MSFCKLTLFISVFLKRMWCQPVFRFPQAVQAVIGATIVGGLSFGVALGTYQAAVCTIRQVRGDSHFPNLATPTRSCHYMAACFRFMLEF